MKKRASHPANNQVGFLQKRAEGSVFRSNADTWNKRWFVLDDQNKTMAYYQQRPTTRSSISKPKQIYQLDQHSAVTDLAGSNPPAFSFQITFGGPLGEIHKPLALKASSVGEEQAWRNTLLMAINPAPSGSGGSIGGDAAEAEAEKARKKAEDKQRMREAMMAPAKKQPAVAAEVLPPSPPAVSPPAPPPRRNSGEPPPLPPPRKASLPQDTAGGGGAPESAAQEMSDSMKRKSLETPLSFAEQTSSRSLTSTESASSPARQRERGQPSSSGDSQIAAAIAAAAAAASSSSAAMHSAAEAAVAPRPPGAPGTPPWAGNSSAELDLIEGLTLDSVAVQATLFNPAAGGGGVSPLKSLIRRSSGKLGELAEKKKHERSMRLGRSRRPSVSKEILLTLEASSAEKEKKKRSSAARGAAVAAGLLSPRSTASSSMDQPLSFSEQSGFAEQDQVNVEVSQKEARIRQVRSNRSVAPPSLSALPRPRTRLDRSLARSLSHSVLYSNTRTHPPPPRTPPTPPPPTTSSRRASRDTSSRRGNWWRSSRAQGPRTRGYARICWTR
jgi:hypothetical protein